MSTNFHLPDLGENIDTATVVEVFVSPGDTVAVDQALMSLETEKAEFELPSTLAGTVAEVLVAAGDQISVGQVVVRIDESAVAPPAVEPLATGPAESAQPVMPRQAGVPAPSRDSLRESSATVEQTPPVAERLQTNATAGSAQTPAPSSSAGSQEMAPRSVVPSAGKPRPDSFSEASQTPGHTTSTTVPARPEVESRQGQFSEADGSPTARRAIAAAPSVRRLARELGVTLEAVASALGRDRLSSQDIRTFAQGAGSGQGTVGVAPGSSLEHLLVPEKLPNFSAWGPIRVEAMSKVRRRTAERLARAWIGIPQVTHYDEADISALDLLRKKHAPRFDQAGGQLTWTVLLLKVIAAALRRFPQLNTSVDMTGARIIYKDYVHVGVAVDTERGLLVPVLRDADTKSLVQLAKELRDVSERARNRRITPDLLQGGTFTITNLGGIGGVAFSPIVNPPEVAILGVSRATTRPIWVAGKFEPRKILPLSLSYDHRVIDGAEAARFLRWVCEAIEIPSSVLDLEGS